MSDRRAQIIASGADVAVVRQTVAELVICADGGLDVARAASIAVDVAVGDFDSVTPAALAAARSQAEIVEAEDDKDETDLELALGAARDRDITHVTVHLAAGGRLDHQVANLAVLASSRWSTMGVEGWVGLHRVWIARAERGDLILPLGVGDPVALQPIGGPARVTTTGVRWPLTEAWLDPTAARGISNEVTAADPTVQVSEGVALVMSSAQAT